MSLLNELNPNTKRKVNIPLTDILPNKMNKYPMQDVEELAELIYTMGEQIEPGQAYIHKENDINKYILTSGERRFRALSLLSKQGKWNGKMDIIIIPTPENVWEERRQIRAANAHREHTPELRKMEVEECEEEYAYLQSINQKPKGLKRDWIGQQLGVSGRTVDRYLNKNQSSEKNDEDVINEDVQKEQQRLFFKNVEENFVHHLQTQVKVTKNAIKIAFNDVDDFNRILEALGMLDTSLE